jgi:hypothetical protein
MKSLPACLAVALLAVACSEPAAPILGEDGARLEAPESLSAARAPKARTMFARYVSLGTSISMGVQDAGVFDDAQRGAWPNQLATRAGVSSYDLPLVKDPGCPPPLFAPLALNVVLLGGYAAFGGSGDLLDGLGGICAPLQSGITLPTNNVAISGANVREALTLTPEGAAQLSSNLGELYSRVLAPGQTQVTAMLAQNPTFVSIELATNEILPASAGLVSALTPYASWEADFDAVVAAVESTGAPAVVVGLPISAANFPSVRTAREFFNQWPYLLGLGITVSWSCYTRSNSIFIPGYMLSLLSATPTTATCQDVPGEVDYILTPADMAIIDDQMARMNDRMEAVAQEHGYAYFDISVVYDRPKGSLDLGDVLFSDDPFGPYMSLDGVHPNDAGHALLADAAVAAIRDRYRVRMK